MVSQVHSLVVLLTEITLTEWMGGVLVRIVDAVASASEPSKEELRAGPALARRP